MTFDIGFSGCARGGCALRHARLLSLVVIACVLGVSAAPARSQVCPTESTWLKLQGPAASENKGFLRGILVGADGTWEWDGHQWVKRSAFSPAGYTTTVGSNVWVVNFDFSSQHSIGFSWDGATSTWQSQTVSGVNTPGAGVVGDADGLSISGPSGTAQAWGETWHLGTASGSFGWDHVCQVCSGCTCVPAGGPRSGFRIAGGVLFGGNNGGPLNDTWRWNGIFSGWSRTFTSTQPSPRSNYALSQLPTPTTGVMLFGGDSGDSETWILTNATSPDWSLSANTGPSGRTGASMCAAGGKVVLFGGRATADDQLLDDTWTWDPSAASPSWELWTGKPPVRAGASMAYDPDRQRLVMFGGNSLYTQIDRSDTWEFDGYGWKARQPATVPDARTEYAMAWDAVGHRTLMVCGMKQAARTNECWAWDGVNWQAIPSGPSPREGCAMAQIPGSGTMVLFGGTNSSNQRLNELWFLTYSGGAYSWSGPFTPQGGLTARMYHSMAADPATGRIYLFGGSTATGISNELWASSDGTHWTQINAAGAPTLGREGASLVRSETNGKLILFAGDAAGSDVFNDIYQFDPGAQTWSHIIPANPPVPRRFHAAGFHPPTNRMVVQGGIIASTFTDETWIYQDPCQAPVITRDPQGSTVQCSQTLAMDVECYGSPELHFQWQRNTGGGWSDLAGQTGPALNLTPAVSGQYRVVISNSAGSATSAAATVATSSSVAFVQQPDNAFACPGQNASFIVLATGSGTLQYQWRKGGVALSNGSKYSGVATQLLTVMNVSAADVGSYSVVVYDSCGSLESTARMLTVYPATSIATQPIPQSVCAGQSATFTVAATGAGTLSYQWRKNSTPISGANASSYSIPSVAAANAGNYDCVVSSTLCAGAISNAAALTVNAATIITTQPVGQTVCAGQSMTFTVSATGTGTLSYRWRKNGADIGVFSSSYTIPSATPAHSGTYDCIVTSTSCPSATSAAAALVVNAGVVITSQPVNSTICPGQGTQFQVLATGTAPLTYQWQQNTGAGWSNVNGQTANTISVDFTTPSGTQFRCIVNSGCGTITSQAATFSIRSGPTITQQPQNATACVGGSATFTITATPSAGGALSYQWSTNSGNVGTNSPSLTLSGLTAGNNGNSVRCTVTETSGCTTSTTSSLATLAVRTGPSLTIGLTTGSQSACTGQTLVFTATAQYSGTPVYQWRRGGTNIGTNSPTFTIAAAQPTDAGTYDCTITDACTSTPVASQGSIGIVVGPGATTSPSLPQDDAFCSLPHTTTLQAGGITGNITSMQWYRGNGGAPQPVPGATTSTLTLAFNTAQDIVNLSGSYFLRLNTPCGPIDTRTAVVGQRPTPTVSEITGGGAFCGTPTYPLQIVLNVAVTNPEAMIPGYLWWRSGVLINGATGPSLTLTLNSAADQAAIAGTYQFRANPWCGTQFDRSTAVSFGSPVAFTVQQPATWAVCGALPQSRTLNMATSGLQPVTYQWYYQAGPAQPAQTIAGATGSSYTVTYSVSADAPTIDGLYFCRATNPCATIDSTPTAFTYYTDPSILQSPASQTIRPGGAAVFTATVTTDPRSTLAWFKNSVPLVGDARITGVNTTTLSIANLTPADNGSYTLQVGVPCRTATSTPATLDVRAPGDFNGDSMVTVQDIFDYLTAFFTNAAGADINHNGSVSLQDLFDFLTFYFQG